MKCIIKTGFMKNYKIDFTGCKTLFEVRSWLNGIGSFISIGEKRIIRLDSIKEIIPDK